MKNDLDNIPLRALKILRKGYKKSRFDEIAREKLQKINQIIDEKARRYSVPKKVNLVDSENT